MAKIDQSQNADALVCWARGDTDAKIFTIKKNGVAQDVSGETFTMSVDTLLDPPDALTLQFAMTSTFVTDGTNGQISFAPAAGDTNLTPAEYFYDIQRDTPSIKTLIKGVAEILQDITKT